MTKFHELNNLTQTTKTQGKLEAVGETWTSSSVAGLSLCIYESSVIIKVHGIGYYKVALLASGSNPCSSVNRDRCGDGDGEVTIGEICTSSLIYVYTPWGHREPEARQTRANRAYWSGLVTSKRTRKHPRTHRVLNVSTKASVSHRTRKQLRLYQLRNKKNKEKARTREIMTRTNSLSSHANKLTWKLCGILQKGYRVLLLSSSDRESLCKAKSLANSTRRMQISKPFTSIIWISYMRVCRERERERDIQVVHCCAHERIWSVN